MNKEVFDTVTYVDTALKQVNKLAEGWRPQRYDDHLTVRSHHLLVASDVHFPKHDESLLREMLVRAHDELVDTIILAGDFFDMEEWSSYGIDDPTSSFRRNLTMGGEVIRLIHQMGFQVVWSKGNHEDRVFRGRPINMELLARMAGLQDLMESGQLLVSDNPLVYAEVGNWIIVHPAQYGSYPTMVASKLATRYQSNVIAAHEHHWGMVSDETGRFIAVSSGGLFDPSKHKYINHNVTSHRAWAQGYVTIHDGQAQLYRGRPSVLLSEVRNG